jgi:hypothetical protein
MSLDLAPAGGRGRGGRDLAFHSRREKETMSCREMSEINGKLVAALEKISNATCERLRTKTQMIVALDHIGSIAAAALAARHNTGAVDV